MRISDWSSDVCSSDLLLIAGVERERIDNPIDATVLDDGLQISANVGPATVDTLHVDVTAPLDRMGLAGGLLTAIRSVAHSRTTDPVTGQRRPVRSEEHTSELQSLMRISYAVFCLKKKKINRKSIEIEPKHN